MSPESAIIILERHTEEVALAPISLERQVLISALTTAVRLLKDYTKDYQVSDVVDMLRDTGFTIEVIGDHKDPMENFKLPVKED